MSIKEKILNGVELKSKTVEIPEWDCTVVMREFNGWQRAEWEDWVLNNENRQQEIRARLVSLAAYDAEGNRIFDDSDIPQLMNVSGAVLGRLSNIAMQMNGLAASAIEDAEKN